jgi:hypothetical protein
MPTKTEEQNSRRKSPQVNEKAASYGYLSSSEHEIPSSPAKDIA